MGFFDAMMHSISAMFQNLSTKLSDVFQLKEITLPVWIALALLVAFAVVLFVTQRRMHWSALSLSVGAMFMALAFVLSYIRLFRMPQSGSITPGSMLPILYFAFLFGWRKGLLCAVAYGLLQLFQDFYALNLLQLVLDYPLAFGFLALGGLFAKRDAPWAFPVGIGLGVFGRFACHVISGAVFFADYAGDMNPWLYSIGYNGSYLLVEAGICVALALVLQAAGATRTLKRLVGRASART